MILVFFCCYVVQQHHHKLNRYVDGKLLRMTIMLLCNIIYYLFISYITRRNMHERALYLEVEMLINLLKSD